MFSPLDGLARLRTGRTRRVSSFDRTGGNADRIQIAPGARVDLANLAGAGLIRHVWFTINHRDPLSRRNLILRMYWDGESEPSVQSPVGDFFGQGWGEAYPFVSLPLAAAPVRGRALNCYFPMPYANGARIEIENDSDQRVDAFYYYVDYEELPSLPEECGRFHAWWNRELTDPAPEGENEWACLGPELKNRSDEGNYLFVEAVGRGHYVGVNYYIDSPGPMWPGEGDDMFVVDGEPWPGSLHGTGTEDYFNMSWCPNELYQHPYFGLARIGGSFGWLGRHHYYRFHLEDPVCFRESLRASIEHGHANCLTLDLASVAYWYQTEPHRPFPPLPGREGRAPLPPITVTDIHRWRDAWRRARGGGKLWGNERGE